MTTTHTDFDPMAEIKRLRAEIKKLQTEIERLKPAIKNRCPFDVSDGSDLPLLGPDDPCPVCGMLGHPDAEYTCLFPPRSIVDEHAALQPKDPTP